MMNKQTTVVRGSQVDLLPETHQEAIALLDPFQRWEYSELAYVQEEICDRDRVLTENAYNDRARWDHD